MRQIADIKKRIFTNRLRRTLLYKRDLRAPEDPSSSILPEGCAIWTLDANDTRTLQTIYPIDSEEDLRRLEGGQTCYVASLAGRLAHFSWAQRSGVHEIAGTGRYRKIVDGDVWIYSARTAEWAKGRSVYPAVLRYIMRDSAAMGCHRAWIYVAEENVPSIRGIEKAGFIRVGRLRTLLIRKYRIPLLWKL